MVALKQWMKFLQGYIKEKKQQLNESELWRMPFLIKYVILSNFHFFTFILLSTPISANKVCSGGPTVVKAKDWAMMNLAKLTGVGAGRNVGLLLAHGKAVSHLSSLAQRKVRASKPTRLVKHQKLQYQLKPLHQMGSKPQKPGGCLSHLLRNLYQPKKAIKWKRQHEERRVGILVLSH